MPEISLSPQAVRDYWRAVSPKMLTILRRMEGNERWTLDHMPRLADALDRFAAMLEKGFAAEHIEQHQLDIVTLTGFIKSGRALRVLHAFEEQEVGLIARLMELAHETWHNPDAAKHQKQAAHILLSRFRMLYNADVIGIMYSPETLEGLHQAIKEYCSPGSVEEAA